MRTAPCGAGLLLTASTANTFPSLARRFGGSARFWFVRWAGQQGRISWPMVVLICLNIPGNA